MTNLQFDEASLAQRLSALPPIHMAAFAACCAERIGPAYQRYSGGQKTGADSPLASCLNIVWAALATGMASAPSLEDEVERCLELMPPEEMHSDENAAYAEDAVAATGYAMRALISEEAAEAAWAARRVYEAVDQYVIRKRRAEGKDPFVEAEILAHPLCQRELQRQLRDLIDLERLSGMPLTLDALDSLRARARAESTSVLD